MAREINRLTTKTVEALDEPGLHADGAGLYLRIDQTGSKRWVMVYFWRGKRREMGLGSAAPVTGVSLKAARLAAGAAREQLAQGIDPIEARRLEAAAVSPRTFGEQALAVIAELETGWRSPKAGPQWTASLKQHAAAIWDRPVAAIDTPDVLSVLTPIWQTIPETATRVRARIERVLDVARIEGRRSGENPARWRGHLQLMLARQIRERGHHAALAYEQLPDFIARLRARPATAARAMEWAILTATRTSETREATWGEIHGDVWIIPRERMKAGRDHRVPLTPRLLEILDEMAPARAAGDYIFPGDQRIEPLSRMAMLMLLRRMDVTDVTVHGFRSAFRDWAGDCTSHPREVIEEALAHVVGGAVERAYRRRDALAKRRALMTDWATFCATPAGSNVIPFRA
ncbi:MAG: integrase arm-type DNA-binding domain-containing protein [Caulobacter sp.]|nr:integrase arm-type DNA-binding domain-containing protein [Caulobacter sp.]